MLINSTAELTVREEIRSKAGHLSGGLANAVWLSLDLGIGFACGLAHPPAASAVAAERYVRQTAMTKNSR